LYNGGQKNDFNGGRTPDQFFYQACHGPAENFFLVTGRVIKDAAIQHYGKNFDGCLCQHSQHTFHQLVFRLFSL
jgi:hypothetical protein